MKKEISIAPMLDLTDSFFRQYVRMITQKATLYTEMIAEQAILKGNRDKLLSFHPSEQPLVLQIGGSTPQIMAEDIQIAEDYGYREVNINAGCPSERVQAGAFGACLMAHPKQIADCLKQMEKVSKLPISIKTRIALETPENKEEDGYKELKHFVKITSEAGCQKFIIHARKARLKGLSPKENRQKLPLNYDVVYRLKEEFPELNIQINGNITSIEEIKHHLQFVDGVMIGRKAYTDSYFLREVDSLFYGSRQPVLSREQIIKNIIPLLAQQRNPLSASRHLMGLYYKTPVAKLWKQTLMKNDLTAISNFLNQISNRQQIGA